MKLRALFASVVMMLAACSDGPPCVPSCESASCGDDGCGGMCGTCSQNEACVRGACSSCGNGILDPGEKCDDSAATPCITSADCSTVDACSPLAFTGSPEACDAECIASPIIECVAGDACCPNGCLPGNDPDCIPSTCGNGQLDDGETCDPPTLPCPQACEPADACEVAELVGFEDSCSRSCRRTSVDTCGVADSCCPAGCSDANDPDCAAVVCGDGVVSGVETCDIGLAWPEEGSCSPDCDDNRACTADRQMGSPQTCDVRCHGTPQTACLGGDGCCPSGCDVAADADCAAVMCGDGVVDGREACDSAIAPGEPGACPLGTADCEDGDPCTDATLVGSAADCSARCELVPRSCLAGDGCCDATCTAQNDAECNALDLCTTYCFEALTCCVGLYQQYASRTECEAACARMATGRQGDAAGDSVYCRLHHLFDARTDPESHCAHAGPAPIDGCI